MSAEGFVYPPSPRTLHWLGAGQLASRFQRTVRLWVLLRQLYGPSSNWARELPETFSYPKLRDRIFAPSHGQGDYLSADHITASCGDPTCICHKPLKAWVFAPDSGQSETEWRQEMLHLTGMEAADLEQQLDARPFATVHRSVRDDLKLLGQLGWLNALGRGKFQCMPAKEWPRPGATLSPAPSFAHLSLNQTWELLQALESLALVQPHLEPVVQSLWEQVASVYPTRQAGEKRQQRIFIHPDYQLAADLQERVETYQEQLKQFWRRAAGGTMQFEYSLAPDRTVALVVYPVCLHYGQQARYLSAYGQTPTDDNDIGWHNYRLDRVASDRLIVLDWDDERVPPALQKLKQTDQLPTPADVETELKRAWGLDFYRPRQLLILRFPAAFARWQIEGRVSYHGTLQAVTYERLPGLIRQQFKAKADQASLLRLVEQRSPDDAYYQAWIRVGDSEVMRRLREVRSHSEVIAPLAVRQQLAEEAAQELLSYVLNPQKQLDISW